MNISEIFEERAAFSFEVFPPKTDVGMEKLCGEGGVLEKLYTLNPDYISCTYGAGGTNVGKNLEVLDKIQKLTGGDSLKANIQLVYNNARLGAQIASELVGR